MRILEVPNRHGMYEVAAPTAPSGLSARRLLVIGKRQWWVVIGCILLAALGSVGYVKTRTVSYSATTTVNVAPPAYASGSTGNSGSGGTSAGAPALFSGDLNPLTEIYSHAVVEAAAAASRTGGAGYNVVGSISSDESIVAVEVTAATAGQAVAVSKAAANAFVTQRIQDLKQRASDLNGPIGKFQTAMSNLHLPKASATSGSSSFERTELGVLGGELGSAYLEQQTYSTAAGSVNVATPASTSSVVVNGKSKKVLEVAVVAGLLAGLGIALAREQFDDKIRSSAEFAEISKAEVLAELPVSDLGAGSMTIADKPFGETAEAVRELRTALRFLSVKRPIRTVLVTSAGAGEGKSFVAANLAAAWAMSGVRTILISSDMRRPSLERLFKAETPRKGLSEAIVDAVLSGHGRSMSGFSYMDDLEAEQLVESGDDGEAGIGSLDVDELLVSTGVDGLFLLPSGPSPPNPAELLGSPELGKLLVALRERAEVLVLDSPPVMAVTDALVLTAQADGVLFVVSENRTSRAAAQRALRLLESGLAPVLGVVVNRSSRPGGVSHY
jgi:succinoglycan biosynthesis transport protein ExoP